MHTGPGNPSAMGESQSRIARSTAGLRVKAMPVRVAHMTRVPKIIMRFTPTTSIAKLMAPAHKEEKIPHQPYNTPASMSLSPNSSVA